MIAILHLHCDATLLHIQQAIYINITSHFHCHFRVLLQMEGKHYASYLERRRLCSCLGGVVTSQHLTFMQIYANDCCLVE